MSESAVRQFRWEDMPWEKVTEQISRRMVTGSNVMLAQIRLEKGAVVPRHSHHNEQITFIIEGALRFELGENGSEEITLRSGEVLHIPSHVPHRAVALEDTMDVDVFSPPRSDWLDGTDSYFHDEG